MKAGYRIMASGALSVAFLGTAWGQAPRYQTPRSVPAAATSAQVETAPLDLITPDRFRVVTVWEPIRRVILMARQDGVIQAVSIKPGDVVRERQELVALDRSEALALLKIAQAEVKERQAELKAVAKESSAIAAARLEAAQARAELAQLASERCTLKAPFAGRVLSVGLFTGQFVTKGTVLAELADVSSLRALVPVERDLAEAGGSIPLESEGRKLTAKIQAIVPLPESFSAIRELASPWSGAWVVVEPNPGGSPLEPGQRVSNPRLPSVPLAVVPARAVRGSSAAGAAAKGRPMGMIQVLRNERVVNVPVAIHGEVGAERTQVTGAFRTGDAAIVESTVALAEGTLVRFGNSAGQPSGNIELLTPSPTVVGAAAEIAAPTPAARVAPIGAPAVAVPNAAGRAPARSAPVPRQAPAPVTPTAPAQGGSVPF